jgi:HEPN domain-containing protein
VSQTISISLKSSEAARLHLGPQRSGICRMAKVWRDLGWIAYEDDDTPQEIRSFNAFGKSAVMWLEQSRSLHWASDALGNTKSAELTKSKHRHYAIALMLGALAVETLLRMVIIADYCEAHGFSGEDTEAKAFLPRTHNLAELIAKAKLRINKSDRECLTKLTPFSVWAGKYPIPLLADGYPGPALFDLRNDLGRLWKSYDALYRKLHRLAVRKTFKGQIVRAAQ